MNADSSKIFPLDENQLKIINESITEQKNQYVQPTEYNTTVLNYDHTQNHVPSFLRGNVVSPKNIATNKQGEKQNTSDIINAQQISQYFPYSTDVEQIIKPIPQNESFLDPEKQGRMGNSSVKITDVKYPKKSYARYTQVIKSRVESGELDPCTQTEECPYCFLDFIENGLERHQKKNPFCINEQKKISENKLKTQNKNEYKEKTVKGLSVDYTYLK